MPRSYKTEWLPVLMAFPKNRLTDFDKRVGVAMYWAANADGTRSEMSSDGIGIWLGMPEQPNDGRRKQVNRSQGKIAAAGLAVKTGEPIRKTRGTQYRLTIPALNSNSTVATGSGSGALNSNSTVATGSGSGALNSNSTVATGSGSGDGVEQQTGSVEQQTGCLVATAQLHNHVVNHSNNHVTTNSVTAAEGSGKDVRSAEDIEREALEFLTELEGGTVEPLNDGSVEPPNDGTVEPTTTLQSPLRASAERERGSTEPKPFVPPPNVKINPPNKFGNRPTDPARFIAPNPRDFSDEKRGVLLREFYRLHPKAQQWPGVRDCILSMGLNPNVTMLELRPDEREKQKARPGYFSLFRNAEPKSIWGDAAAPGELPFRYHQEMQTGASVGIDQGDRFTAGNSEYDPSMDW